MRALYLLLLLSFAGPGARLSPAFVPQALASQTLAPQTPAAAANPAGAPAEIRFAYENSQLQPAKYLLEIREDGSGTYRSEPGDTNPPRADLSLPPLDRQIQISRELREKLFHAARKGKYFNLACESGTKNIAFQGFKTLRYEGVDGHGSCAFNWTYISSIQYIADTCEALSLTLEEGARLDVVYRHRPLGLDSELATLQDLVERKQALELENIAPILSTIANDEKVLKGARRTARSLLAAAGGQ